MIFKKAVILLLGVHASDQLQNITNQDFEEMDNDYYLQNSGKTKYSISFNYPNVYFDDVEYFDRDDEYLYQFDEEAEDDDLDETEEDGVDYYKKLAPKGDSLSYTAKRWLAARSSSSGYKSSSKSTYKASSSSYKSSSPSYSSSRSSYTRTTQASSSSKSYSSSSYKKSTNSRSSNKKSSSYTKPKKSYTVRNGVYSYSTYRNVVIHNNNYYNQNDCRSYEPFYSYYMPPVGQNCINLVGYYSSTFMVTYYDGYGYNYYYATYGYYDYSVNPRDPNAESGGGWVFVLIFICIFLCIGAGKGIGLF